MAEIYQLPENGNNNGTIPFSIPIGLGNGFGGGFGSFNSIADLFGLAIIASMFGWGNGGFGGGFGGWGGNAGGAGFLSKAVSAAAQVLDSSATSSTTTLAVNCS